MKSKDTKKSRVELLFLRAEALVKQEKMARHIASNLSGLENISDEDNRIILINRELGIPAHLSYSALSAGRLNNPMDALYALNMLSDISPLAQGIYNLTRSTNCYRPSIIDINNEIIPKLVARRMNEAEYTAYMKGEKPVADSNGRDFYLPQPATPSS